MIVELSTQDVTRLSMGDDVQVGGVTLRLSMSLTESVANGAESLPPSEGWRMSSSLPPSDTSNAKSGDLIFRMFARFNGRCAECKGFVKKGGPIVRDTVHGRNLCMTCGEPVLAAYRAQSATAV